ncbi:MAG: UDP-N-acetylglucosamine 2-epimerase (hydrolyzing) [Candidatus Omnitrophota bacterium]|nr:MAG: UDP-N-acetylglucosamine 2-epimerase (hydrolyzing) [Candidatus Omnitrophota bacterium]
MKRKVCIVTSSRAEYGLLRPLLEEIANDKNLTLQLIVTGMHLSPEFGLTYREIEKDGFAVDEKIEILLSSDTPASISKSMGLAMISFSEAYGRLKSDIIVVLGDRFEFLSAVAAALISRIPVAHIAGGEVTEAAFDDSIRHSITKMSHLHFTIIEDYRKRVIQLGEDPQRVFNVGALGIDNIKKLKLFSREALEKELNFKFNKHNLLVTFHPVTLENNTSPQQFKDLLSALENLEDTFIIFTKANADPGGRIINKMIDTYVSKNCSKSAAFTSLGHLKYLSILQFVDAVVGNSSSGIVEAPSFKMGTINIGGRQKGRVEPKSIIDCQPTKESIIKAFEKLYSKEFQRSLKKVVNPYGDGNAAKRIKNILKNYDINNILKKPFFDIDFGYRR